MMSGTIIARPARVWMINKWSFLDNDIIDQFDKLDIYDALVWQIEEGWALSFGIFDGATLVPLALAGLFCDDDSDEGQVWFHPTVQMPDHYRTLLKELPRYIGCLIALSNCSRATTLIDPTNKNFKKFARLVKFHYSCDLELNGVSFEEWEFRG